MTEVIDNIKKKLMQWYENESKKFIYLPIDSDHVIDIKLDKEPLIATEHYFRLWLKEMYLKNGREIFTDRYPVVHSLVKFRFGNNPDVNIPNIAGPLNIEKFNSEGLKNVIQLSYKLTNLIPFNGGDVEIAAGLVAMKGENYLNNLIKMMSNFAAILTQPQLSLALNVAEKLTMGMQDLFNTISGDLHLGMHQTFTGKESAGKNLLKAQYIAVIKAQKKDVSTNELWIENDGLYYGKKDNIRPFTSHDYMLFLIEKCNERDDWSGLRSINEPFMKACENLILDPKIAKRYIETAIMAALTSDDLTRVDKIRVVDTIQKDFNEQIKLITSIRSIESSIDVQFPEQVKRTSLNRRLIASTIDINKENLLDEKSFNENIFGIPTYPNLDHVMKKSISIDEARKRIADIEKGHFILEDVKGQKIGAIFGKSPQDAALMAAGMGFTDIRLKNSGLRLLHIFRGSRDQLSKPKGAPTWMRDKIWKPNIEEVGVVKLEEPQTVGVGVRRVMSNVRSAARGKIIDRSKESKSRSMKGA